MAYMVELTPELRAFFDELATIFGTPAKAFYAFAETSNEFLAWRTQVQPCPHCQRFTLHRNGRLELHRIRNPDGDVPHQIPCPGSGADVLPWRVPQNLDMIRGYIEHRIRTVRPGMT